MAALTGIVADGGPIVVILIALSILSIALIVAKVLELRGALGGEGRRGRALELWSSGDRPGAMRALEADRSPVDRMLMQAMAGLASGTSRQALDDALEWRGNAEVARMSRNLRLLELIAMVSPLLGLLGTVLGMIQAFRELALAEGAANASLLAAGIWQALLTTAAGLIVAIPAAIAASLLASRVDAAGQRIEATVGRLYAIEDRLP